jgi:GT2 family glycosyltransferase
VHNRRRYTECALGCLARQTWPDLHAIVVDDGSTDGTAEMVRRDFPDVTLLRGDGSLFWTGAANLGIRHALESASPEDYVLALNDDLEIDDDFVETLVRFAMARPRALVGAVTVDITDPERIDDGGVSINWWTAKHRVLNRGRRLSEFASGHTTRPSYLTGRGVCIPVSALLEVGLYDDRHFQQCGDSELPIRAARRGYELFVLYDAIARSHMDAALALNRSPRVTLRSARDYFFGVRSNTRLKYRWYIGLAGAGPNPLRLLCYLSFDLARITASFVRRLEDGNFRGRSR